MVSLVSMLATGSSSWAFMGSGPKTDSNEQLGLLFGKNTAFTATADMSVSGKKSDNMSMEMDYAMLDGKVRTQMDMTKAKMGAKQSDGMEQMAAMGLNMIVTLVRPDKKMTYMMYPGLSGYCEFPQTIGGQGTNAPPKIEKTELGKETIDGHPCVKNKVVITTDDGKQYEMFTWQATDMKDFPIKSEMKSGNDTITTVFKNIKLTAPPASLFEIPANLKKYGSMQEMMMSGMQKMMQGLGQ